MADNTHANIFRKKALDRISSPENLTDYLRVANPGIWVVLAAVILLLAGVLIWSSVGTLDTTAAAKVIVEDQVAEVVPLAAEALSDGMPLRVAGQEYVLNAVETDVYGRSFGIAQVSLPDGIYDGQVVTETIHPIDFLLTSK